MNPGAVTLKPIRKVRTMGAMTIYEEYQATPDVVLSDADPDGQVKSWIVEFPDGAQVVLSQSSGGTAWVSALEEAWFDGVFTIERSDVEEA